jgi:hypothetical protein
LSPFPSVHALRDRADPAHNRRRYGQNPGKCLTFPGPSRIGPDFAPRPLGPDGTGLWNRVMAAYRIEDEGGIELLAQACAALDRAEALAAARTGL